jgi:hypothetical protein
MSPRPQREDDAKKGRDSKLDTAVDSLDSPSWHAEPSKSSELEERPGYGPDPEFLCPTSKCTLHAIDPLVRMLEPRTLPCNHSWIGTVTVAAAMVVCPQASLAS